MLMNRQSTTLCGHFLAIALLAAFFVGCGSGGPKFYPVAGKVVFNADQSTAQFGSIEFRSETEPPVIARGQIAKDGTFQLSSSSITGTVAGWHTVVIQQVIGNERGGGVVHHHGLEVHKKYIDHRTTDLRVEVKVDSDNQLELLVDEREE